MIQSTAADGPSKRFCATKLTARRRPCYAPGEAGQRAAEGNRSRPPARTRPRRPPRIVLPGKRGSPRPGASAPGRNGPGPPLPAPGSVRPGAFAVAPAGARTTFAWLRAPSRRHRHPPRVGPGPCVEKPSRAGRRRDSGARRDQKKDPGATSMFLAQCASRTCHAFTCAPSSARIAPRLSLHGSFARVRRALTAEGRRAERAAWSCASWATPSERAGLILPGAGARHLVWPPPFRAFGCGPRVYRTTPSAARGPVEQCWGQVKLSSAQPFDKLSEGNLCSLGHQASPKVLLVHREMMLSLVEQRPFCQIPGKGISHEEPGI